MMTTLDPSLSLAIEGGATGAGGEEAAAGKGEGGGKGGLEGGEKEDVGVNARAMLWGLALQVCGSSVCR